MPTVNIKAFSHKKSTVVENGGPKLPTAAQLELGEIAINFAKGYETLSIKNNNDEIVTFTNDNYWINKELTIAAALNDLNDRKQDALEMDEVPTEGSENVVTSGGLYSYITEIEQVTAAALNDLNDRITSLALSDDYAAAAQGTPPLAGDTYEEAISKLHGAILENELATAGALNDLNSRISDIVVPELILSEDYEPSSLSNEDLFLEPGDSYETAFAKLEKTINDNENITSAALTDLDSRLNLLHLPQSLDDIPDGSTRKLSDYATVTSVNSSLATKQNTLVSGTNIKTINNESILGSGNIIIQGGGGDTNVIETVKVNGTALTPDANKAVNIDISGKQDTLTPNTPISIVQGTGNSTGTTYIKLVGSEGTDISSIVESTNNGGWEHAGNLGIPTVELVRSKIDLKYTKPSGGIPKTDLASAVQTSLGLADTALQSFTETDPVFSASAAATITSSDITNWNGKSNFSGSYNDLTNKPTIPNDSNLVHKTGNETISGIKSFQRIKRAHTVDVLNEAWNWITYDDMDGGHHTLQQDLDARNNVQANWNQTTTTADDYIKNKPTIPAAVTESTVSGWGFTKNTGTYSKPSGGIPKTDLASAVQTSLGKADSAIQSVKVNGTALTPDANKAVDITVPAAVTESTVSGWGFTKNAGTITGITMNGSSKGTSGVVDLGTVLTSFTETDPTVPAWAKASTKPTYTAAEVGALPSTYTPPVTSVNGQTGAVNLTIPAAPGTLNTTATTAQSTSSSEALSGNITLHKVAKTGTYNDLIGKPTIPTVNNATLTIQKNGTTVNTFTANASSNVTANIQVNELPTVSSSDNGKVLMVVNGAWSLVMPTSIYSGTSTPDSNTGNNGDLYLQTS